MLFFYRPPSFISDENHVGLTGNVVSHQVSNQLILLRQGDNASVRYINQLILLRQGVNASVGYQSADISVVGRKCFCRVSIS